MDWKQLLARLAAAKLTQVQIAEQCGVSQSTISDLARGATKSPSFELGSKLRELAAGLPEEGADQGLANPNPPAAAPAPLAQQGA